MQCLLVNVENSKSRAIKKDYNNVKIKLINLELNQKRLRLPFSHSILKCTGIKSRLQYAKIVC